MGGSVAITEVRVYDSIVTTEMAVEITVSLCKREEGDRNQRNHTATVTWRTCRLAVWFSYKRQI